MQGGYRGVARAGKGAEGAFIVIGNTFPSEGP